MSPVSRFVKARWFSHRFWTVVLAGTALAFMTLCAVEGFGYRKDLQLAAHRYHRQYPSKRFPANNWYVGAELLHGKLFCYIRQNVETAGAADPNTPTDTDRMTWWQFWATRDHVADDVGVTDWFRFKPIRYVNPRFEFAYRGTQGSLVLGTFRNQGRGLELLLPLPLLQVSLVGLAICIFVRRRSLGRRSRLGLCQQCGYDLRMISSRRCPECGVAAIFTSTAIPTGLPGSDST